MTQEHAFKALSLSHRTAGCSTCRRIVNEMANAIEVCRLAKSYGNVEAVRVDFYVRKALCLPSSSQMALENQPQSMLTTILKPDAGKIIDSYRLGQDDEKSAELALYFNCVLIISLLSRKTC